MDFYTKFKCNGCVCAKRHFVSLYSTEIAYSLLRLSLRLRLMMLFSPFFYTHIREKKGEKDVRKRNCNSKRNILGRLKAYFSQQLQSADATLGGQAKTLHDAGVVAFFL